MEKIKNLSPSVLAFVGDAVYSLKVRTYLADVSRPSEALHNAAVEFVSAAAQAKSFNVIKQYLSEEEHSVFLRGRNFHTGNTPKSSSPADYHTATGLETLFGYLHLSGKAERIDELFDIITKNR